MQIRSIRYFCDVARLGSFTAAAEANLVSQSAVSQQVKALERELGVPLVEKKGRSFALTRAGRHFAAKAPSILDELERLQGETVDIALGNPTALRIGYLSHYDGWEVATAVAALKRRHPYAEISSFSSAHEGLYEQLRQRKADIVFNDKRRAFSDEYENRLLMTGLEYVEVSEVSPLAGAPWVTAQQLEGQPCVIVASYDQRHTEAEYYRNVLNLNGDFLFADNLQEARMMVAADRGFLRIETAEAAVSKGSVIRRIPLMDARGQLRHDYYAFYPARGFNPLAPEFADILEGLF